jgi:hypothetical protein
MRELEMVDAWQCPECGQYYPDDSRYGESIVPHLVENHPESEMALAVAAAVERGRGA